jgi:hypothetical protein
MDRRHALAVALVLSPVAALAQPTLESLWPNPDGLRWEFEFRIIRIMYGWDFTSPASLQLGGHVETPGGTAQVLHGNHDVPPDAGAVPVHDPLLRAVWQARPDLRAAIIARAHASSGGPTWWPLLLGPGNFIKNVTNIQMWQPGVDHPTWTYLTSNLAIGATFTQQLIPEFSDDVFLHGTVTDIDVTVSTIAGTFEHAVKMTYRIEYGWSDVLPEPPLTRSRWETHGHVHYVPDVGPVDMLEEYKLLEIDCAPDPCPPEWQDRVGTSVQTITLSLTGTVSTEARTWSQVKSLYH